MAKQKTANQKVAIPPNAGLSEVQDSGNDEGIMAQDEFVSTATIFGDRHLTGGVVAIMGALL